MKRFCTVLLILGLASAAVLAQTTNGTGGGAWSSTATWAGGSVPTGAGTITIAATDSVLFDVPVSITGTMVKLSAKKDSIGAGGSLTFANGSMYQHAVDGGYIPTATWSTGSTCLVTGVAAAQPLNSNQNFHHFVWNNPSQGGNQALAWLNNVIGGDLRVYGNGAITNQFRLTTGALSAGGNAITINGNVIVNGANAMLTTAGSGTPVYTIGVTVKGSILDSAGSLILCNGSGGIVNWYVQGNVYVSSAAVCTTNSTMTQPDSLIFSGTSIQTFVNGKGTLSNIRFSVRPGAILDLDTNRTGSSSNSTFTVEPGATVISGRSDGLAGNLNCPVKTLSKQGNYTYDGTVAQSDALLPDTVKNLTINNTAGFALLQPIVITGVLTLQAGQLDNSVHGITIAPGGSVVKVGGSTAAAIPGWPGTTGVGDQGLSVPQEFSLGQNYPNPFNPTTQISYDIPRESYVSLKVFNLVGQEVATLVSRSQVAGRYTVPFDASNLSSGVYLYRLQAGSSIDVKRMMFVK